MEANIVDPFGIPIKSLVTIWREDIFCICCFKYLHGCVNDFFLPENRMIYQTLNWCLTGLSSIFIDYYIRLMLLQNQTFSLKHLKPKSCHQMNPNDIDIYFFLGCFVFLLCFLFSKFCDWNSRSWMKIAETELKGPTKFKFWTLMSVL